MNRTNFGRRSGVVIDRCKDHGVWFDAAELDAVLRFIREGGEALAEASRVEEERAVASAARFRVEPKTPEGAWRAERDASSEESGFLPFLLRFLTKNGGFPGR
jgi:Zn-finger nucleic acid-binding protein